MKNYEKIKGASGILGILLIISGSILAVVSIIEAVNIHQQRIAYLDEEYIHFEKFSVPIEDGITIKGFLHVNQKLKDLKDQEVPTILMLHGVNGRKERGFSKIYQLVKRGYAVLSVEERGHGESGGISSFLEKEPRDMMQVIDHVEEHYAFADASHIGLWGFSYGGGVACILQAIDDRVHASVIYHPLSSIDKFTEDVPFQNLLGKSPEIEDVDEISDAYDLCTPENTENLLLIHGDEDDVITVDHSRTLYERLEGEQRHDIQLEIRQGLGHGANEGNVDSLKHSILWFDHFLRDPSVSISNRDAELDKVEIHEDDYPGNASFPKDVIWFASILLFIGLSAILIPVLHRPDAQGEKFREFKISSDRSDYNRMIFLRSGAYMSVATIGGLFCALFNPSYIYGYCLAIPLTTIFILAFIPSPQFEDWKAEWTMIDESKLKETLISLSIIIIPSVSFVLIYNANARLMRESPIPFFTSTTLVYTLIGLSVVFADYMLIRGWKISHGLLLMVLRPFSLLIFFLFVPLPPFPYLGALAASLYLWIILLIGIVMWIVLAVISVMSIFFKNRLTVVLITLLPMTIFLVHRFFRII